MKKNIFQTETGKTNSIIALVGIAVILFSLWQHDNINAHTFTVFISIGTSIVASSIVAFITTYYFSKNEGRMGLIDKWGIKSISETRGIINNEISSLFEHKVRELDIIAYGLKSFREARDQRIRQLVTSGMKMRIITVNPENDVLIFKDKDENKVCGSTAASIIELLSWCKDIGNIEVKCIDTLPTELYFRVDSDVFVGPYQIGRESQQTITIRFEGKADGVKYYNEYFEKLWKTANTPHKFLI